MVRRRRPIPSDEGDPLIPLMNLVCLLIPLLLFGAIFVRFVVIDVQSPKITPSKREPAEALNLHVVVTDRGFHLKVNPRFRQPWMTSVSGAGIPDIPKKDDHWDFDALNRRLLQLKELNSGESAMILSAEDDVAYEVLIKTLDHSRGTPQTPLFPEVTLGRGVV